jgi:hypothetical protein
VCWKCKKIERGCYQCKACEATHYAEIEAQDASEEAKSEEQRATEAARAQLSWARGKAGPLATIVSSRYGWEGGKWLAFPGLVDEVDPDAFGDDPESHEFWTSDAAAFVGRGDTPDVALADLMKIANDNAPREEPAS